MLALRKATAPPAPPPATATGRAKRLAALTGGAYVDEGSSASVVFAPSGGGAALARSATALPGPARPTPVLTALATPQRAEPPSSATALDGLDLDELYEQVAARLRRELLHDRERAGDLLGDLPALRPPL